MGNEEALLPPEPEMAIELPQRSNSFTACFPTPLDSEHVGEDCATEINPFLQNDDSLTFESGKFFDEALFDREWSLGIGSLTPGLQNANPDLEIDFQQDLLESRRLTELFDNSLDHLLVDDSNFHIPVINKTRMYNAAHEFTQSSPALVSIPVRDRTTRSLPRRRSRYGLYQSGRRAVAIPQPMRQFDQRQERATAFETPLERWQNSPPDNEPAPITAIREEHERRLTDPIYAHSTDISISREVWTGYRTPSRANSTTGSEASELSVTSNATDKSSASQRARKVSQRRKSRIKKQRGASEVAEERLFKCTFCCDDFKHKYDWARHEKSLHLNIGGWRCTPFGPIIVSPSSGRSVCAFCNVFDPDTDHVEKHNYEACLKTLGGSHVFQRKDHLTQHLRLVHHLEAMPLIEDWTVPVPGIRSRCGICDTTMQTWDERAEHLAVHFRNGLSMENWEGPHNFEPSIASQVINSLPPWLIKYESKSIIPFSATNSASRDQYHQHIVNAAKLGNPISQTQLDSSKDDMSMGYANVGDSQSDGKVSFELLTSHLGRFAREQIALGIVPTDEMFQKEARKLFYDDDDEWNQTVADDSAWLSAFRLQNQCNIETDS